MGIKNGEKPYNQLHNCHFQISDGNNVTEGKAAARKYQNSVAAANVGLCANDS